jgi:AcrR family transcriptional regulator
VAGGRLSEQAVLAGAVDLARRAGVEGLTMRALAESLGVSTMATYHYVASRTELLLLVADGVMGEVEPPPPGPPWDQRLWTYMLAMADALGSVPGLVDFLVGHDLTTEARRYMQRCIALVREGGFDDVAARRAFMAIYTYMWGSSLFRANGAGRGRRAGGRRRTGVPGRAELASRDNLELGYRALVTGLEQMLR